MGVNNFIITNLYLMSFSQYIEQFVFYRINHFKFIALTCMTYIVALFKKKNV